MINVIIGPPCAGKSSFVEENKKTGDVSVDFDLLAVALGSETPHESTGDIRKIALRVRFSAIRGILDGIESNSWIIHTNPGDRILNDYSEAGAKFTLIDPGKDICKERLGDRSEDTLQAIDDWYKNPPSIPDNNLKGLYLALRNNILNLN